MSNPVQNKTLPQDLFYSLEDAEGSITFELKFKDIEINTLIFFEETKSMLGISIPTGRKILTKVIKIQSIPDYTQSNMFWITVKKVN